MVRSCFALELVFMDWFITGLPGTGQGAQEVMGPHKQVPANMQSVSRKIVQATAFLLEHLSLREIQKDKYTKENVIFT